VAVLVFSGLVYAALMRAMHRPVETGHEALLRAHGVVESDAGEPLAVRIDGERWSARSSDKALRPGEKVCVIGMEGLVLRVARRRSRARPPTA
jgi:membrane-bound ClpP family serine protease